MAGSNNSGMNERAVITLPLPDLRVFADVLSSSEEESEGAESSEVGSPHDTAAPFGGGARKRSRQEANLTPNEEFVPTV